MNSLMKVNKLTKKIILQELAKMIYDHSLNIEQSNLDKKIDILFEDCQNLSAERFIDICKNLRAKEMFGRLPANFHFTGVGFNITCEIAKEINKMCYDNLVAEVKKDGEQIKVIVVDDASLKKIRALPEDLGKLIIAKLKKMTGLSSLGITEVKNG